VATLDGVSCRPPPLVRVVRKPSSKGYKWPHEPPRLDVVFCKPPPLVGVAHKPPSLARVAAHVSLLPTSGMWPTQPTQQMRLAHKPPHLRGHPQSLEGGMCIMCSHPQAKVGGGLAWPLQPMEVAASHPNQ
jgi:hypothetical protein